MKQKWYRGFSLPHLRPEGSVVQRDGENFMIQDGHEVQVWLVNDPDGRPAWTTNQPHKKPDLQVVK